MGIAGLTVLDQLSYVLDRAIQVSKDVSNWVTRLIKRILSATGKTVSVAANMTIEFIRWVFSMLSNAVNGMVTSAMAVFD